MCRTLWCSSATPTCIFTGDYFHPRLLVYRALQTRSDKTSDTFPCTEVLHSDPWFETRSHMLGGRWEICLAGLIITLLEFERNGYWHIGLRYKCFSRSYASKGHKDIESKA